MTDADSHGAVIVDLHVDVGSFGIGQVCTELEAVLPIAQAELRRVAGIGPEDRRAGAELELLSGIANDPIDLILHPFHLTGGVPAVRPVGGSVMGIEQLAGWS